jgi:hypothetical protein
MVWNLKDDEMRDAITAATAPPRDPEAIFANDFWANAYSVWSTDRGFATGDYAASLLHRVWIDLTHGASGESIRSEYVDPASPSALPWPSSARDRFERVAAGMEDDYSGALGETRAATIEMLGPPVDAFLADVGALQAERASEPTRVELTRDRIDMGVIDATNQAALKSLPEAEGSDSFATFVLAGDVVLIGDDHPSPYYAYVEAKGATKGQIYMNKKGSAFSAGELRAALVSNLPISQEAGRSAEDALEEAIGRVSKKKVKWR